MESGWGSVEEFVTSLEIKMDEEDSEIKETELSTPGHYKSIVVESGNKKRNTERMDALVDKMNRVYLPPRFAQRNVVAIVLDGVPHRISKVDERYEGDDIVSVVCYLEGGNYEAGSLN